MPIILSSLAKTSDQGFRRTDHISVDKLLRTAASASSTDASRVIITRLLPLVIGNNPLCRTEHMGESLRI